MVPGWRIEFVTLVRKIMSERKRCHSCRRTRPYRFFRINRKSHDGVADDCLSCENALRRAARQRRQIEREREKIARRQDANNSDAVLRHFTTRHRAIGATE